MKTFDVKVSIILKAEDEEKARQQAKDAIDESDCEYYLIHQTEDISEYQESTS
jgi:hypothetical protein